jgi:DNA-binding PadR family transcriptional regulator
MAVVRWKSGATVSAFLRRESLVLKQRARVFRCALYSSKATCLSKKVKMAADPEKDELSRMSARVDAIAEELSAMGRKLDAIWEHLSEGDAGEEIPSSASEQKSHFMRIAEILLEKGNAPTSTLELVAATGLSHGSLSQVIHRTHKECFISTAMPGYARKKLWELSESGKAAGQLGSLRQPTLFGGEEEEGEFGRLKATDCCFRILRERGGEPLSALALAREAIARGYRGKARGPEDEVLSTTMKSFWAALSRDSRFEEVRPLVFTLRGMPVRPPNTPGCER